MVNYPNYQSYYQPYMAYQQPIQQPIQQQQTPSNQILAWVQSEEEARNFPLTTGQSIFLMNQNDNYIYMKSVDQLGKTSFLKKRLVDESDNQESNIDLSEYIRKEEIDNIIMDIVQKEVERRMSQISFKPTRKKTVVVDEDEE